MKKEHQEIVPGQPLDWIVRNFCGRCLGWECLSWNYPLVLNPVSDSFLDVNDLDAIIIQAQIWCFGSATIIGIETAPEGKFVGYIKRGDREIVRTPPLTQASHAVMYACAEAERILDSEAYNQYFLSKSDHADSAGHNDAASR